mgnify:CR=1 FL=1
MELDSSLTGTLLRPFHATVGRRQMMNYAAAIGDHNVCYFNDESPDDIIAHPMQSVAVTWPVCGNIRQYLEGDFPEEIITRQVHYTEYLEFHRPIRPEDSLIISGRIAAILPHRAGTHVVVRFDARDQDAEPVFTEFMGAMMRGVACLGGGAGREDVPVLPEHPGASGGWETRLHIDPLLPYLYDGCTDIVFPIHTSPRFARAVGLPGIILQGTATLALAVRELVNREAGGDPRRLKRLYCRFTGMVIPGSDITVRLTGAGARQEGRDLFFQVENGEGQRALSDGYAAVI